MGRGFDFLVLIWSLLLFLHTVAFINKQLCFETLQKYIASHKYPRIIFQRSYDYKQWSDVIINSKHKALQNFNLWALFSSAELWMMLCCWEMPSLSQYHPIIIRDRLDSTASSSVESIGSNFYLYWQRRLQIGADWSGFLFSPPTFNLFSPHLEVWHLLFSTPS